MPTLSTAPHLPLDHAFIINSPLDFPRILTLALRARIPANLPPSCLSALDQGGTAFAIGDSELRIWSDMIVFAGHEAQSGWAESDWLHDRGTVLREIEACLREA